MIQSCIETSQFPVIMHGCPVLTEQPCMITGELLTNPGIRSYGSLTVSAFHDRRSEPTIGLVLSVGLAWSIGLGSSVGLGLVFVGR